MLLSFIFAASLFHYAAFSTAGLRHSAMPRVDARVKAHSMPWRGYVDMPLAFDDIDAVISEN